MTTSIKLTLARVLLITITLCGLFSSDKSDNLTPLQKLTKSLLVLNELKLDKTKKDDFANRLQRMKGVWTQPHVTENPNDGSLAVTPEVKDHLKPPMEDPTYAATDENRLRLKTILEIILKRMNKNEEAQAITGLTGFRFLLLAFEDFSIPDEVKSLKSKLKYEYFDTLGLASSDAEKFRNIIEYMVLQTFVTFRTSIVKKHCDKPDIKNTKAYKEFKKGIESVGKDTEKHLKSIGSDPQGKMANEAKGFAVILDNIFEHNLTWFCNYKDVLKFSADDMLQMLKMQFFDLESILVEGDIPVDESSPEIMTIIDRQKSAFQYKNAQQSIKLNDSLNLSESKLNESRKSLSNQSNVKMSSQTSLNLPLENDIKEEEGFKNELLHENQIQIKIQEARKPEGQQDYVSSPFIYDIEGNDDKLYAGINCIQVNIFYILRAWFTMYRNDSDQKSMVESLMSLIKLLFQDLNRYLEYADQLPVQPAIAASQSNNFIGEQPNEEQVGQFVVRKVVSLNKHNALIKQKKTQAALTVIERSLGRVLSMVTEKNTDPWMWRKLVNFLKIKIDLSPLDSSLTAMWDMIKSRVGSNGGDDKAFKKDYEHISTNFLALFELGNEKIESDLAKKKMEQLEKNISEMDYTNWRCNFLVHVFFYGYGGDNHRKITNMPLNAKIFFLRNFQCIYNQHVNFYKKINDMVAIHKFEGALSINGSVIKYKKSVFLQMFFLQECYNETTLEGDCSLKRYQLFLTEAYLAAFENKAIKEKLINSQDNLNETDLRFEDDLWVSDAWLKTVWNKFNSSNNGSAILGNSQVILPSSDNYHDKALELSAVYDKFLALRPVSAEDLNYNTRIEALREIYYDLYWILLPLVKATLIEADGSNYTHLINNPLDELKDYLSVTKYTDELRGFPDYAAIKEHIINASLTYFTKFEQQTLNHVFTLAQEKVKANRQEISLEQNQLADLLFTLDALRVSKDSQGQVQTILDSKYRINQTSKEAEKEIAKAKEAYKGLDNSETDKILTSFSKMVSVINGHKISNLNDILAIKSVSKLLI
jgi:hypothetical protein